MGGSNCHASLALATAFPQLRLIVQDLPDTITLANNTLSNTTSTIRSRITLQAHDFFQPQPVVGANAYLLRMILHDWADPDVIKILRNLLPALAANHAVSRLLIMDTVLPVPGENEDPIVEAMLRVRDLTMLQAFNSSERELADWERLLEEASADGGFKFVLRGTKKPFGSNMSVLEVAVVPAGINGGSPNGNLNGYVNGHRIGEESGQGNLSINVTL